MQGSMTTCFKPLEMDFNWCSSIKAEAVHFTIFVVVMQINHSNFWKSHALHKLIVLFAIVPGSVKVTVVNITALVSHSRAWTNLSNETDMTSTADVCDNRCRYWRERIGSLGKGEGSWNEFLSHLNDNICSIVKAVLSLLWSAVVNSTTEMQIKQYPFNCCESMTAFFVFPWFFFECICVGFYGSCRSNVHYMMVGLGVAFQALQVFDNLHTRNPVIKSVTMFCRCYRMPITSFFL